MRTLYILPYPTTSKPAIRIQRRKSLSRVNPNLAPTCLILTLNQNLEKFSNFFEFTESSDLYIFVNNKINVKIIVMEFKEKDLNKFKTIRPKIFRFRLLDSGENTNK